MTKSSNKQEGKSQDPRDYEGMLTQTGHGQPEVAREEIARAKQVLSDLGPAVSVFGSARTDRKHPYYKLARESCRLMGENGFDIITGGGPGLMEACNRGAKEAGVNSVGLHMLLPDEQAMNRYVTLPLEFNYFFCRKIFYVDPAQAFVCFPGGSGTLDELFEVITLIKTSKIPSYPLILAPGDYWRGLVEWLKEVPLEDHNIDPIDIRMLRLADTPEEILEHVQSIKRARRRSLRS